MGKRNIRVTLAYDGTDFCGWQSQRVGRTVQGTIQEALKRMHGHAVHIQGAGRTDAGVHATGQVANFHTDLDSITAALYWRALNSYLPQDIRVLESREVPESFHAKEDARSRTYAYFLYPAAIGLPHLRRYCWKLSRKPDFERLNRMAAQLVGTHDFSTFAAAGDASRSKVRRLTSAGFTLDPPFLVFRVTAGSFLWKMVRSVIGTILELETSGAPPEALAEVLASRERSRAGPTAPARGLFLERILYDGEG